MTAANNTFTAIARHNMLNTFAGVAQQFEQAKNRVTQQEQDFNTRLALLTKQLEQAGSNSGLDATHPLAQQFAGLQHNMQQATQRWLADIAGQKKGTDFRARLGDSLLVFVYGKVKAGKSSLSNYMACGQSVPDASAMQMAKEQGLKMIREEESSARTDTSSIELGFGVARQECTHAIQYFTLPGLTWIDSPGLHSENEENGSLSRQYAASADLIIYVMNAANPARESDLDEIRKLVSIKKPVLILITGCDQVMMDENDQGEIIYTTSMFTAEERQNQVKYVQEKLELLAKMQPEARNLVSSCILPVSVHMAERARTEAEFTNSGMQALLEHLQQIAGNDSLRLKQQAPLNNLNAFIEKTCTSVRELESSLQTVAESVQHNRLEVEQEIPRLVSRIQTALHGRLRTEMNHYQGDSKALANVLDKELRQQLELHIGEALRGRMSDISGSLRQALERNASVDLPDFGEIFESFDVPESRAGQRTLGRVLGGLAGGAAGFFFGGPAGAAAGAAAGAGIGGSLGGEDGSRKVSLAVGDNRDEIADSAREQVDSLVTTAVEQTYAAPMLKELNALFQANAHSKKALHTFRCEALNTMEQCQ